MSHRVCNRALCAQSLEVKCLELWAEESGRFWQWECVDVICGPTHGKNHYKPQQQYFPQMHASREASEFCANSFIMKLSDQSIATQRGPDDVELMALALLQL